MSAGRLLSRQRMLNLKYSILPQRQLHHTICIRHYLKNQQPPRCAVRAAASGASALSKAANSELRSSKNVTELVSAFDSNADYHDRVTIATTWVQLGKLRSLRAANDPSKAFARRILGKTLAYVNDMDLRQLSNVVWGVGCVGLDLGDTGSLGPYFVQHVEERVQELLQRQGFSDEREINQLCFGLSNNVKVWSKAFLARVVEVVVESLEGVGCWEVSQACISIAKILEVRHIPLDEQQQTRLARIIEAVVDPDGGDNMTEAVQGLLMGAIKLQLPLAQETVRQLHNLAVSTPLHSAQRKGRFWCAGNLHMCCQLNYQPTAAEAQSWAQLLLEDLGSGRWTQDEFTSTVHALASCQNYSPPPWLKERVAAEAATLVRQGANSHMFSRVAVAVGAWGVPLPADVQRGFLKDLYSKKGGAR